ncbi:hypothetical protein LUZ60_005204 [Juncus effusus]|nr:hypothetical protein LUZ60_005204 [Juncus effusus]
MLLSLLFILSTTFSAAVSGAAAPSSGDNTTTIYDLLPLYGLPPGIFPDTVTSYTLSDEGDLAVNLSAPCEVEFDYLTSYETSVTGVLRYGSLDGLKGIQVRKFLIWFDVDRIKVDLPPKSYIYFDIGWITRKLDVDQFETVHSCKSSCKLRRSFNRAFQWTKDFFTDLLW